MLTNLHTFNIAARVLSFKETAEQLALTNSAVSHRIRALEKELGFQLFIRRVRHIELTEEGKKLLAVSNRTFDALFSEVEQISSNELSGEIYIAASPSIATCMLLPRLSSFQARYPNLNVKLIAHPSAKPFDYEPIDLAIFYGKDHYPNYYHKRIINERVLPVCTHEYAQQHHLFDGIKHLATVNFLHAGEKTAWQHWLDQMAPELRNCKIDPHHKYYDFNTYDFAHTAAKNGLGVAIARESLVTHWLASGELVSPFPAQPTGLGYDIVCLPGGEQRPKFIAFMDWLENESGIIQALD
ncbi:hypothetical protein A3K86_14145 [Photobacterium jeanii]|uniref:HTH lysR-type domain-containing protein n=2 Tax=Photobacterium jeanii TaxID=858640 RepID=A0A178K8N6_9GAMM|nr:hypothetical protein A3K86_14145 [Photobacterium jeanii]